MEKKSQQIRRVAILGAESTGKTTLARLLASHFNTVWVEEYARNYMQQNKTNYSANTIIEIAKKQLQKEEESCSKATEFIFIDTEFIIAKGWCEDVFGFCPTWINNQISEHRYDLYLLTDNNLPWIADPVRVNPERRDYFFTQYKNLLELNKLNYEIITGNEEDRLTNGINAIRKHFKKIV